MKFKNILLFLIMAVLLISSVLAISPIGSIIDSKDSSRTYIVPLGPGDFDEDFYNDITQNPPLGDPVISRNWQVNGATCSEYADTSVDWTPFLETTFCYNNQHHPGVAVQLFEVTSSGWVKIAQLDVPLGEQKCASVVPGKNYHYDYYYCDTIETTTCVDTDSGTDYKNYGEVTITGSGDHQTWEDDCSGNTVLERICDQYNGVGTVTRDCTYYGSDYECKDGKCQVQTQSCESHDSKKCYGGHVYWYDACNSREERYDYCPPATETCSNGECILDSNYILKDHKKCYNNDVYWYDSEGVRGALYDACGILESCADGVCLTSEQSKEYDLRVTNVETSSPYPGGITTEVTLKNWGTKQIKGMLTVEVCTDQENSDYNCDGRNFYVGRAGFTTNLVCQNSEDQQVFFVLEPGESSSTTVTGKIGTGGTYPVVLSLSDKCYNTGGVPLIDVYPGIKLTGFGFIDDVKVYEPFGDVVCSGNAAIGDYKCISTDLTKTYVCRDDGEWFASDCQIGTKCDVDAGSVCKPLGLDKCNNDGVCTGIETIDSCPLDCALTPGSVNETNFVCVRSQKTVSEQLNELDEALENLDNVGNLYSSATTVFDLFKSIFIWSKDSETVENNNFEEAIIKIKESREVLDAAKKIDGHYWDWISEAQYNDYKELWYIQDLDKDSCLESKSEIKNNLEGALELYNLSQYGEVILDYVPSVDPANLKKMTSKDKLSHSCISSSECEGEESSCYNLNEIVAKGWLTESDASSYMDDLQNSIIDISSTGVKWGAIASSICVGGLAVGGVFSGGAAWAAIPLCTSAGFATYSFADWLEAVDTEDHGKVGLCIDEQSTDFLYQFKQGIADAFNWDVDDSKVMMVIVGLAIALILIILRLGSPPA